MHRILIFKQHQRVPIGWNALLPYAGEKPALGVSRCLNINAAQRAFDIIKRLMPHFHVGPQIEQFGKGKLTNQAINVDLLAALRAYLGIANIIFTGQR